VNTANTAGFGGAYARERDERNGLLVFSGNSNRPLATEVCRVLNVEEKGKKKKKKEK